MVAEEAHTSSSVKDLIVAAKGVPDAQWEGIYTKATGGILTVRSELGEPIHKIATRAVKLWKEFDNTVFKLPKEKRRPWLAERRAEIIAKLNKDFNKPWFGAKKDRSVVEDIAEMTYEEVVLRTVRLMYVAHQERWVDLSLRNLTGDWLRRVEERFAGVNGGEKASILQSYSSLDKPHAFVEEFFKAYPLATEQLLTTDDKVYFLAISQRPGQKPVPSIPVLDAMGLRVLAIDTGAEKKDFVLSLGAEKWIDFKETKDLVKDIVAATDGLGAHAAVVTAATSAAYE